MTSHDAQNHNKNTAILLVFLLGLMTAVLTTLCLAGSTLATFDSFGLDWGATVLLACVPLLGIFIGLGALCSTGFHAWLFLRRHHRVPTMKYFVAWGVTWVLAILSLTFVFLNTANHDETAPVIGAFVIIILANVVGPLLANWADRT